MKDSDVGKDSKSRQFDELSSELSHTSQQEWVSNFISFKVESF